MQGELVRLGHSIAASTVADPAGCLSPVDWYPLFPNPAVAESLLEPFINDSHQVFMNGPSYWPRKRPGQRVTTTTKEASH